MKNDTIGLNETSIQFPGGSDETEWGRVVGEVATGMGLYVLALLTCVGNAMVIHAIRTEKRLKTVSNSFIMSLAVADLMVGAFVMPISAIYAVTNRWYLGAWLCEIWLSIDYTASTASIFNLFVLSMDRYWSITSPLKYLRQRTKRRALLLITVAWTLSSLWILPVTTWHRIVNSKDNRQLPANTCDVGFAHNLPFKVTAAVVNFYIPTLAMLYVYARIFSTIRHRSRSQTLGVVSRGPSANNIRSSAPITASSRPPGKTKERRKSNTSFVENGQRRTKIWRKSNANTTIGTSAADDSSDTLSSEAEDERNFSPSLGHRLRKLLTKSDSRRKNTINWTCQAEIIRPSDDYLLSNGDVIQQGNLNYCSYYKSLILFDAREQLKRSETSHLTHYENVQVNVEYVQDEADETNCAPNTIEEPQNKSSQGTQGSIGNQYVRSGLRRSENSTTTLSSALISQKERKAARQLGVIMCAFIICWLPYFIVFLVVAICPSCISRTLQNVTLWLGYANSTLNPCLYPLCNRNFRRAFSKMARCCRVAKNNRHQTYPMVRRNAPWQHDRY